MSKYKCDCEAMDIDDTCDACVDQWVLDAAEAKEESRQAAREYWADREADYAYDPLSKGGFE